MTAGYLLWDFDAFHAAALDKDNGAFVLDPDGHNIEAVCHAPEA